MKYVVSLIGIDKVKIKIVDPPSGWKYGFPKQAPEDVADFRQWLLDQGYPEKDVDFAMKYCRVWYEEVEDTK